MNTPSDRLSNLFGALALGVADRIRWAALDETSLGGEASAALVVIGHASGLSIHQLARVLRLSHAGTVRLVDRLVTAGLAQRTPGTPDRRVVALVLTDQGHRDRTRLLEHRRQTLDAMLTDLDPADRAALERIADKMLPTLPDDATSALTVCRLCDDQQCADCPMDRFGALG